MNLDNVKTLIDLLENHPLEEIKYSFSNGESVHLVKEKKNQPQQTPIQYAPQETLPPQPAAQPQPVNDSKTSYNHVKSPIVGTFYAAASPDKPPFVNEGDKVESGQTLCIIEAMKILNPVTSPYSGVIRKIHVSNESPVEYNQILFDIEPV